MRCHLASEGGEGTTWAPLRLNDATGKVEVPQETSGAPGLWKREASFSTQMVRRAVSFIFEESPSSPLCSKMRPAIAA